MSITACQICPHYCQLSPGEMGKCLVRKNIDGYVVPIFEGQCSIVSVEPIEKRPLFHFYPGSKFLSVGFLGCQMHCRWCQTSDISQSTTSKTVYYSPQKLVELAVEKGVEGIVFTFNEPTIHYEYIMDVYEAMQKVDSDLKIVLKSNGFINKFVLDDLDIAADAWNVDIKGGAKEYKEICEGDISPILLSIETLASRNTHLEISYLVLPHMYDDMEHHQTMRNWLADLSVDIPIHLLFCYPSYRMSDNTKSPLLLRDLWEFFKEKMSYVYISNVFQEELLEFRNTRCPVCQKTLIERNPIAQVLQLSCCGQNVAGQFSKREYNICG